MDRPANLEPKGEKLWDAVTSELVFDAAGYALLEDICRTTDIIERLTKKLKAPYHEWVRMVEDAGYSGTGTKIIVVVDQVLGEIRQQRLAQRQMWQHLTLGKVVPKAGSKKSLWDDMSAFEQDLEKKET